MRTQDAILEKIKSIEPMEDMFGATRNNLIDFLDYEHVKEFLKEGRTPGEWKPKSIDFEAIKAAVADYMPFAWEKANDMRGISANRSIDHMRAYVWLANDPSLSERFESTPYEHYGKEILAVVCDYFLLDWKQWDHGVRTNG